MGTCSGRRGESSSGTDRMAQSLYKLSSWSEDRWRDTVKLSVCVQDVGWLLGEKLMHDEKKIDQGCCFPSCSRSKEQPHTALAVGTCLHYMHVKSDQNVAHVANSCLETENGRKEMLS